MKFAGCDFHPSWQQIALLEPKTQELSERKLENGDCEVERSYRELSAPVFVEIEVCGNCRRFIE
jgi:hypothetical protein